MDIIVWLALLAYTIYDWQTARTWWVPWSFLALTILYGVWFFAQLCRTMARGYLERLVAALRDRHVTPATGDEMSRVFAECVLSPTGRQLMMKVGGAGSEPGNLVYSPEALSVLTAFAEAGKPELDANTLRWLRPPKFSWARLRERWFGEATIDPRGPQGK